MRCPLDWPETNGASRSACDLVPAIQEVREGHLRRQDLLVPAGQRCLSNQQARLDPPGQRGPRVLQDPADLAHPDLRPVQVALGAPSDRPRLPGQSHPFGPENLYHPWDLGAPPDRPRLPGRSHPPGPEDLYHPWDLGNRPDRPRLPGRSHPLGPEDLYHPWDLADLSDRRRQRDPGDPPGLRDQEAQEGLAALRGQQ